MEDLLTALNLEQRRAVLHHTGPALVIAGAGSGKTRTVVHRIAYLMAEHGVYPTEILAVTFTNKAAGEMKERLKLMVGRDAQELWVSTFHSAALRILRIHGQQIGLRPGFVIYDDNDQVALLKEVLGGLGVELAPKVARGIVDRIKSSNSLEGFLLGADTYVSGLPKEHVADIYRAYENRMAELGAVDFNDLLIKTIELFEKAPQVLAKVQQRARFIHVDEYQDTNPVQYRLTNLLAGEGEPNLMVVGDPDQSIYGFRNADIHNILSFTDSYPTAKVYRLEANYRSSSAILKVANAVIEKNQQRLEKTLIATKGDGEPVFLYRAPDHREEAVFVARESARLVRGGLSADEIAVLYRTNAQSRVLEEAFGRMGMKARIVGGVGFYQRREIRDVLAYVRLSINPSDDLALRRILNVPTRGVGSTSVSRLGQLAGESRGWMWALQHADEVLAGAQLVSTRRFVELADGLREAASESQPEAFLRLVLQESGYTEMLRSEADGEPRLENLEELLRAAHEWQSTNAGSIAEFLDEIALTARAEEPDSGPTEAVILMTLHNAKGLEFKVVFLVGIEENLLPHRSSLVRISEIEEERRLFYVGITRAQDRLYLALSEEREMYGRREPAHPSRFLEDIPQGLLELLSPYGKVLSTDFRRSGPAAEATKIRGVKYPAGAFKGGEIVRHPRFGSGRVVATSGAGEKQEVTVAFEGAGLKKLVVKYASLEQVE